LIEFSKKILIFVSFRVVFLLGLKELTFSPLDKKFFFWLYYVSFVKRQKLLTL